VWCAAMYSHCLCPLLILISLLLSEASEDAGTARIFPLLPPYRDVDFAANFNKLKSSGDAAYFVVRDSTVLIGVNLMWAVVHWLLWDGTVSNNQDIISSILSPGVDVQLSQESETSRFGLQSISELSPTKLWNFFTDPNPSTRNLYLNIGFAAGSHILWILPTFLGIIPEDTRRADERQEDRVGGLPNNLAGADPVALWNRLLSPQGVLQMMAINTLNWLGKIVFWTFMSSVPDAPTGRRLSDWVEGGRQGKEREGREHGWLELIGDTLTDNIREAVWQLSGDSILT